MLEIITPVASTVTVSPESAPTASPPSFVTANVPDVVSLAFDVRKFAAEVPPSASAFVAVP